MPHQLIRLGGRGDGAYLLPDDLQNIEACFSPGVCDSKLFEDDLTKKFNIDCHMCDFSTDLNKLSTPIIKTKQTFEKKWLDRAIPLRFKIINSPMAAVIGIFEKLYKDGKPLTIVKPGTQRRDFTHISDIVKGCILAWRKGRQSDYMLGTKKNYSIIQIAKMFKSKIKYLPSRAGERLGSTIPNNNAYKHLGYRSKIDIKDYIQDFVKKNI